ncbi:MAG: response regulator transcription factor [Clostridiales Family XIII bacterium]|nr:response regulator transcription factor [Clostridiales Family XIII bacterium]
MRIENTVLLVEDNPKLLSLNCRILENAGHRVMKAKNLAEARAHLKAAAPDAVVLDIMLPDGSGLDFMPELRETCDAPVLFLTAKTEREDKLAGLRAGGNDYITKPYDIDELRERVAAFLRLSAARKPSPKLVLGALELDVVSGRAFADGEDLLLTQKEFALLLLLTQHEGKTLTADYLYERVWKSPISEDKNAIKITVSRLRNKLSPAGLDIVSSRGKGYALEAI